MMLRARARALAFLAAACFLLPGGSPTSYAESLVGKVVAVSDGDTITILRNNRTTRVRFAGIDCPEKRQPFGRAARKYTSDAVFGKTITVEVEDTDKYDRIVGTVHAGRPHAQR